MILAGKSHSPITLAGTPNYLTLSNQEITLGTVDIGDDTNLAVTSPIVLTGDTVSFDFTTNNSWSGTNDFTNNVTIYMASDNATLIVGRSGAAEDQVLRCDTTNLAVWVGDFFPVIDNTYDLGSSGVQFKDLYLAGNLTDTTNTLTVANCKTAFDHVTADGSSHTFIDQNVTTLGTPVFARLGVGIVADASDELAFPNAAIVTVAGGGTPALTFELNSDLTAANDIAFSFNTADANTELTASSGSQTFFKIEPRIAQSGTAGYEGVYINVLEDSIGSGTSRVLNFRVGGAARFLVDRTGVAVAVNEMRVGGDTSGGAGFVTMTNTVLGAGGNTVTIETNTGAATVSSGWLKFYNGITAYGMPMLLWDSI